MRQCRPAFHIDAGKLAWVLHQEVHLITSLQADVQ